MAAVQTPATVSTTATATSVVASGAERNYSTAIDALLSLQSNNEVLKMMADKSMRQAMNERSIPEMVTYAERLGLTNESLDGLNIIHVTGTKGKGSTCAMVESILRARGFKTGLFTSPHLIEARERIRINGSPIPEKVFSDNFWEVWDTLGEKHVEGSDLLPRPMFFRFLTLLGLQVFVREGVDVAVLEVGVGGMYDATNFIPPPVVCGITSIGYDHVEVLGKSLSSIATQKGGIVKPGVIGITVPQEPEAMESLVATVAKREGHLFEAPPLSAYTNEHVPLGLAGRHQQTNASLAVALSDVWVALQTSSAGREGAVQSILDSADGEARSPPLLPISSNALLSPSLSEAAQAGLASVTFPGRGQVVDISPAVTVYLDGAHTFESVSASAEWFAATQTTQTGTSSTPADGDEANKGEAEPPLRVLVFNCKSSKDPLWLLLPLLDLHSNLPFDAVLFSSSLAKRVDPLPPSADGASVPAAAGPPTWQGTIRSAWCDALAGRLTYSPPSEGETNGAFVPPPVIEALTSRQETDFAPTTNTECMCVPEAMDELERLASESGRKVNALVTGSFYLVGAVLEVANAEVV